MTTSRLLKSKGIEAIADPNLLPLRRTKAAAQHSPSAVCYLLLALCLTLFCRSPAHGQNLLRNSGFETLEGAGGSNCLPVYWQREFNEKLSGPFMVVKDAHRGKHAVCLMTEEWNFLRPQFLTQEVKLPRGAVACVLSAFCKGQGLVNLVFQFRRGSVPLETEATDLGWGSLQLPKESLNEFGLEQDYQKYEAYADIPEGADSVLVKLGNTADPLNRLNVWGKVLIDDASLTVLPSGKMPSAAPSHPVTESVEVPPGLLDVAQYAHVTMQPASLDPWLLVDGDVKTTASYRGGLERAGNASFSFAGPLPVEAVVAYLNGNADTFTVRGDAKGDGHYEKLLALGCGITQHGWVTLQTGKARARAIRIQALKGKNLHSGYRATLPFMNEVRVLVPGKSVNLGELERTAAFRLKHPLAKDVPTVTLKPTDLPLPEVKQSRFRKMVCADLWMWGVDASKKDSKLPDFPNPVFAETLKGVKAAGVDTVLVDLTNSSCWDLMPWPSKVCNGTNENHLKALVSALHAEGLKVLVEIIHNVTPFETVKWHYPEEETSRYPQMKQYPSILHGNHVRDNWLIIMDEIMACGADGVGISSDEQYYKGHFMETFPADDPGRAIYRQRFGHDLPEHEEDTLAFRQWIAMRHEGLCDLFGYWTRELERKYPGVYTNTMLMHYAVSYSYLTETGIPLDLLGARGGVTEIGSDYMGPYGIRMASAANGWRKATMLHSGNLGQKEPDMHFYGTTLWNWMYGCGSTNYWRYNWIQEQGSLPALTKAYAMARDLEALGAWDARPPKKIALLSSRASLDWWQIKAWWGSHDDPNWDRGLEGQRSWFADESVFNMLQKNGYPFDWFFLDQLNQLENLGEYKVLVAPFAYSVRKAAADKVKAAVANGAKLLLLDGRQGEMDEWGELHPVPVFKELVDSGKAVLFKEDALAWNATDSFVEKVTSTIDQILGDENPLRLNRYGKHVDATVLNRTPSEQLLFLLNWEKEPVAVDVGLSLPEGNYAVFARDENQWHQASLDGKNVLTRKQLRKFRVAMGAEKPYVFYVRAAP